MDPQLQLYRKFIPAPDFSGGKPWSLDSITQTVENSKADESTKKEVVKRFTDLERFNWVSTSFSTFLTPDMFGETYWAAAALAMYNNRTFNYSGVKIDFNPNPHNLQQLPAVTTLQRNLLNSINPYWEKEGQNQKDSGNVTGWSHVNEFLLPLYLVTSQQKNPSLELHNCLRGAFHLPPLGSQETTELQKICEAVLQDWLKSKGIKSGLTTVCVWVRAKLDPSNMGDAVNNLTQDHYQNILEILKSWTGQGGQRVEQIILLGDQPDLKEDKLYSETPYDIATSSQYFGKKGPVQVVDLLQYFRNDEFKKIVGLPGVEKLGGSMACQMLVCDILRREYGLQCLIGKKSGGMDGPTMIGIRQIFFEEDGASDSRMGFTALIDPLWIQVPLVKREQSSQSITIHSRNFFRPQEKQRFLEALELGIRPKPKKQQ